MRFVTIEPAETRYRVVEADNAQSLYAILGLEGHAVDHGVIEPVHVSRHRIGIAIVVDEFSLFVPPEKQRYFVIGDQLYGGNALLYSFDEAGETVDMDRMPPVIFVTMAGIEMAIAAGQIKRPILALNDEVFWRWPEPSPYREAAK